MGAVVVFPDGRQVGGEGSVTSGLGSEGTPVFGVAVAPQGAAPASSIEVYDWARHAWRPLVAGALGPDQTGPGVVRVRVQNGVAGQVPVGLSDLA